MSETQVYFKDIRKIIIENLNTAKSEILIAVAWFTDDKIIKILNELSSKGVKISIIFYDDKINNKDLFETLYYKNAEIKMSKKLMHNKFCIIDRKTVINGSYNWTYNAATNEENIQINKNNYELVNSFVEQFNKLNTNCKSINNHFNYSIEKISNEINFFNINYRENLPKSTLTPYFYKFKNLSINQVHIKRKVENGTFIKLKEPTYLRQNDEEILIKNEGILIIKNRQEEYSLFILLYLLRKEIPLFEVNKFKKIEVTFPVTYESIINLDFENDYTLKSKNYILTSNKRRGIYQLDSKRKGGLTHNMTIIDKSGEILNSYSHCHIMENGFFLQDMSNLYDSNFNKINLIGEAKEFFDKIGYINFTIKYGLTDFSGKTILDNKFDYFHIIDYNTIEFIEFPRSIIMDSYEKGKPFKTVQKYSTYSDKYAKDKFSNCYKEDRNKSVHKKYIFKLNTKELEVNEKIYNAIEPDNYIFTSKNPKSKEFILQFENLIVPLNSYMFYKRSFESATKNFSESQKHLASEKIYSDYLDKIKAEEIAAQKAKEYCYLATMVYKDINHPKVEFLRKFRDDFLDNYFFGRVFIRYYYKYSPRLVNIFRNHKGINYTIKFLLDTIIIILRKKNV